MESGGDNLTATFSYGLVDVQIFVIDVAGGDKVPRKGGPGITASDLLVINKTDLAGSGRRRPGSHAARRRGPPASAGRSCSSAFEPIRWPRRWHDGSRATVVRGRAQLTAAAPVRPGLACRIVRLQDEAPVAWRCTPEGVYLVGTAATPAGDDAVEIDVAAEPGADLRIRSAAATVAWRSCGTVQQIRARVADGARLDWRLEPLIATAGCCHRQHAVVELQGSARLRWTEELLLGRYREQPGRLDLRLDVELDGRALLRHQIRIGSGGAWDGPAILGPYRTLGLVLQVEPDYQPSAASRSWLGSAPS